MKASIFYRVESGWICRYRDRETTHVSLQDALKQAEYFDQYGSSEERQQGNRPDLTENQVPAWTINPPTQS
jgi:hypothetical protein